MARDPDRNPVETGRCRHEHRTEIISTPAEVGAERRRLDDTKKGAFWIVDVHAARPSCIDITRRIDFQAVRCRGLGKNRATFERVTVYGKAPNVPTLRVSNKEHGLIKTETKPVG